MTLNLARTMGRDQLAAMPTRARRRYGLKTTSVVVLLVLLYVVQAFLRNPAIEWDVVGQYMFSARILHGVWITLLLTGVGMAVGVVLGVVIALMRLSNNRILEGAATVYVWFFRGIPQLVLLVLAYNFSLFYAHISLGVPYGPELFSVRTNVLLSPIVAAVLAFALNESAFSSEIIRAAILSVPKGQRAAATAMGMTPVAIYRRVILPQALRMSVPPLSNDVITTLKTTSLVAFIGVSDLMYTVQSQYQANFKIVPLLMVGAIWYLVLVSLLTVLQSLLEQFLGKKGLWVQQSKPPKEHN
ncbi:amino acid ABC transporter permease [Streptomyces shenzhenensis]|uniref:amino acid ABC transporter permease n=1 Tax=Streptomyces shenzhenensis TaxID=943815 RepID=UPI0033C6D3D9